MSFKTLNIGATALMAQQSALNTVGHNIANAATPGYTRQRVNIEANLPDVKTYGAIGSGASVGSVKRISSDFLDQQVREAGTLQTNLQTLTDNYQNIEAIFNELSGNDLSSDFDQFWNSIGDMNNNIEDVSTRTAMVEQARVLTETFNNMDDKLQTMRDYMNNNVETTIEEINTILVEVAELNKGIVKTESGGLTGVVANDSRDQRGERIRELAEIMDITVQEEDNGALVVSLDGHLLVFESQAFSLTTETDSSSGMLVETPVFSSDLEEVDPGGGKLGAFLELRDSTILGFIDDLDQLAATFSWEFNVQHSQGQGLAGYTSLQSTTTILDPSSTMDSLGYNFTPLSDTYDISNGNAEILVRNEVSGEVTTQNIEIDLDSTGEPDTVLYFDNNIDRYDTISKVRLSGMTEGVDTGSNGELYWNVTGPGPAVTVEAYQDAARTVLAASGVSSSKSGTVTLSDAAGTAGNVYGTVDLNYTSDDSTIVRYDSFGNSFVQKLENALDDAVPGVFEVSVDVNNRITIDSTSSSYTFGFGSDSSGVFAALGLNTFFSGYDAGSLGVNSQIVDNPEYVAGAQSFVTGDNDNSVALLQLRDTNIFNSETATVDDFYQGIVGRLGIEYSQNMSMLETQEDILMWAENQREDLSGVSLDEELTKMIQYQRSYQSAARFISTADTMYETLINM